MSNSQRTFWRWSLGVTGLLTLLAFFDLKRLLQHFEVALLHSSWTFVLFAMALFFFVALGLFWLTWRSAWEKVISIIKLPLERPLFFRLVGVIVFVVLMLVYAWLFIFSGFRWLFITDPSSGVLVSGWDGFQYLLTDAVTGMGSKGGAGGNWINPGFHLWIFWLLALAGSQVLKLVSSSLDNTKSLAFAVLTQAVVYKLGTYLPGISSYPFSLGWSETSRFYYGSLLFAERLYNMSVPFSSLHPTRYFLLSIPFAFGNLPILYHRIWQVLLWVTFTGVSSWVLVRRLRLNDRWLAVIIGLWASLYFLQGAVYYHLQVCVIVILAGFSVRQPWRNLILVILASFWAGMSRVNWFPVPGMLAGVLYWLEQPVAGRRSWWDALAKPALWFVVGIVTALVGQAAYISLSGNTSLGGYTSSFTSDLLWDRLLPNATYAPGVIPAVLYASAPLLLIIIFALRGRLTQWNGWRQLGLLGYTLVLFGGGLVVSTKIGGGGDLHNMDAYLVLLLIVGTYLYFNRFNPDGNTAPERIMPWALVVFALIVPTSFVMEKMFTVEPLNLSAAHDVVGDVQRRVNQKLPQDEILFIAHRQLLTFGELENVSLIPDYELLTLMEMAMSRDAVYLNRFYTDLQEHRFSLIVANTQNNYFKNRGESFGEENNAWVQYVSIPLLCEYEPVSINRQVDLQIFVPRNEPPSAGCYSFLPEP